MELLRHALTEMNEAAQLQYVIFSQSNGVTTTFDYETQLPEAARFARDNADTIVFFYVGEIGNFLRYDLGSDFGTRWQGWATIDEENTVEIDEVTLVDAVQAIPMGVQSAYIFRAKEY